MNIDMGDFFNDDPKSKQKPIPPVAVAKARPKSISSLFMRTSSKSPGVAKLKDEEEGEVYQELELAKAEAPPKFVAEPPKEPKKAELTVTKPNPVMPTPPPPAASTVTKPTIVPPTTPPASTETKPKTVPSPTPPAPAVDMQTFQTFKVDESTRAAIAPWTVEERKKEEEARMDEIAPWKVAERQEEEDKRVEKERIEKEKTIAMDRFFDGANGGDAWGEEEWDNPMFSPTKKRGSVAIESGETFDEDMISDVSLHPQRKGASTWFGSAGAAATSSAATSETGQQRDSNSFGGGNGRAGSDGGVSTPKLGQTERQKSMKPLKVDDRSKVVPGKAIDVSQIYGKGSDKEDDSSPNAFFDDPMFEGVSDFEW